MAKKYRKTRGNYGVFLTFAELRSGNLTPEIRRKEKKKDVIFEKKRGILGSRVPLGVGLEPGKEKRAFPGHLPNFSGGHFGIFSVFLHTYF